jgi:hypothetical protein
MDGQDSPVVTTWLQGIHFLIRCSESKLMSLYQLEKTKVEFFHILSMNLYEPKPEIKIFLLVFNGA